MIARCSHPTCRTTLTEEDAVYCDHSQAFCADCDWLDGCLLCALEAAVARVAGTCTRLDHTAGTCHYCDGTRIHPTDRRAYAWPDDSAAALIRDDRDHENGERLSRYADRRDSA